MTAAERAEIVRLLETTRLTEVEIGRQVGRASTTISRLNVLEKVRLYDSDTGRYTLPDGEAVSLYATFDELIHVQRDHWLWRGKLHTNGYPRYSVKRRWSYASRIAWQREHGPIREDINIVRQCLEPLCIAPAHFQAMPQAEVVRNGSSAKLTRRDVEKIRKDRRVGRVIALEYGVSRRQIDRIRQGVRWAT